MFKKQEKPARYKRRPSVYGLFGRLVLIPLAGVATVAAIIAGLCYGGHIVHTQYTMPLIQETSVKIASLTGVAVTYEEQREVANYSDVDRQLITELFGDASN